MSNEAALLWEKVLEDVEKNVSTPSYETWLKSTRPLSIKDDNFFVEVPNDYARNHIISHHKDILINTLRKISQKNYYITYTCMASIDGDNTFFKDNSLSEPDFNISDDSEDYLNKKRDAYIKGPSPWLNPKYTFETFVIGHCNRLAHAASLAVSESPSRAYNPLFIYGGSGLGKTHLMHAISHFIFNNHSNYRVSYFSSETFTNEFINAIRDNKTINFRNKYRNVDVLLIDDIQFLANKEQTQEEFFHTFNSLHENNKQIIISSDRPPKEIPTLEDRLRSRFEWGLITDITKPDLETRIAILKKKARLENIKAEPEVFDYIASKIETNIRELEGALVRIMALSSINNIPVDLNMAEEALHNIIIEKKKDIGLERIIEITALYFGLSIAEIKAKKRTKNIAFARQIAMYLCRELTDLSLPKIGSEFGGKDHTTVMHACNKIKKLYKEDTSIKDNIQSIKDRIHDY